MKTIKTYIVFTDYFMSEHIDVYYIGKSKRQAREEFRRQAFIYMLQNKSDSVKLRLAKVDLPVSEYEYITDVGTYSQSAVRAAIDDYELTGSVDDYDMVNHLTFEFDFLPYFCKTERINPLDLKVEGVLDKLIATGANGCIQKRLKKYLKKNF